MDETKVPPGWVQLTERDDASVLVAARKIESVSARLAVGTQVVAAGRQYTVTESPTEVAALIAEAEAAERRARALPAMAAILRGVRGEKVVPGAASGATYEGCIWTREGAVREAAAILDAIEQRESTDA